MNTRPLSPRSFRVALWLALFAALVQLALGFQSARHQAGMLAAGSDWQEVCTADGLISLASDSDGERDDTGLSASTGNCALCAASGIAAAPPAPIILARPSAIGSVAAFSPNRTPTIATRFAPRPPGQGPPLRA